MFTKIIDPEDISSTDLSNPELVTSLALVHEDFRDTFNLGFGTAIQICVIMAKSILLEVM